MMSEDAKYKTQSPKPHEWFFWALSIKRPIFHWTNLLEFPPCCNYNTVYLRLILNGVFPAGGQTSLSAEWQMMTLSNVIKEDNVPLTGLHKIRKCFNDFRWEGANVRQRRIVLLSVLVCGWISFAVQMDCLDLHCLTLGKMCQVHTLIKLCTIWRN